MAETPEDLNLPNTVITRLIKDALPEGVNVGKDARLAIAKAASVFVLYATSCANNYTMQSKRKTISGQDVLEAMKEMEFERFVEPLTKCLEAYKKDQKQKKESSKKSKEPEAAGDKAAEEEEIEIDEAEEEEEEEVEEEES